MSKGKKIYCIASFAFACAVLILTITLCMMHPGRVYASSMDPDSITKITQKDTQGADHNTDNANGLSITYNNDSGSVSTPIKMLLVLTILSLAPSILIMMTSFTRIIIVLHFLRTAIGTQTTPPNQVLIGLALFLTFLCGRRSSRSTKRQFSHSIREKSHSRNFLKKQKGRFVNL